MINRFNRGANRQRRLGVEYVLVLVLLFVACAYLSRVFQEAHHRDTQLYTTQQLSAISAKLHGTLTNNLSLLSGLAAHVAINPDIQQPEFERYVRAVFRQEPLLVNMAAAPDMVVSMIYPLAENRAALGLDYRDNAEQWAAARRARESGDTVVTGPVNLVQGGQAFIGRKAVYTDTGVFWGLVASPIYVDTLYRRAGLESPGLSIAVAIRGDIGGTRERAVFFGDAALFDDKRSVLAKIDVGDGGWQLAAQPKGGWDKTSRAIWLLRIGFLILATLLTVAALAGQRHLRSEQRYREILHRQAVYDQLTKLPNRFLFEDTLEKAISNSARNNLQLALLFIDLDNFKPVNDNLGHKAGDALLQEVAARLTRSLRKSDTVARYSGDEFIVIIQDVQDINSPPAIADHLLKAVAQPYILAENQVFCTASIGIAMYPGDARTMDQLVSKADQAMYEAKKSGRNSWRYFTSAMQVHSERRHQLFTRLASAIVHKTLEVHYQPIVSIHDGSIRKCEALVRWFEDGKQIDTADFIALAEETGMVNEIDSFVLATATSFLMEQSRELNYRLGLSINISPKLFAATDDSLQKWLAQVGAAIQVIDLTVEITERLLTEESERMLELLHQLKDMGVSIAIDDFGTGYSSLSYLIKFPIDIVKIDRGFVNQLGVDKRSEKLTQAIIGLSKDLSLQVVAEGVETDRQLDYLQQWGCDYGQGYFFAKPLGSKAFAEMLFRQPATGLASRGVS